MLAVLTTVVVSGALWFLWFGGPILNPPGATANLRGQTIINRDAKIVRPIPADKPSARDGVVEPDSKSPAKPALTRTVRHKRAADSDDRGDE